MNKSYGLAFSIGLLCVSPAMAGQREDVALVGLPHEAVRALHDAFPGADVLNAQKESEGDKECYVVTVMRNGRQSEYYVSRDGHVFARKVFLIAGLPQQLTGYLALSLLLGLIPGSASWVLAQVAVRRQLSVMLEWLAAWIGATIGIGVALTQMAKVPRENDLVVLGLISAICGGVSASTVASVGLASKLFREPRYGHLRSIFICVALACVFVCLSIPVDIFRAERENEYYKSQVMKSPHG